MATTENSRLIHLLYVPFYTRHSFLFNYFKLWRSYAISVISVTTQWIFYISLELLSLLTEQMTSLLTSCHIRHVCWHYKSVYFIFVTDNDQQSNQRLTQTCERVRFGWWWTFWAYHRLRGSASPVLTVTHHSYGSLKLSDFFSLSALGSDPSTDIHAKWLKRRKDVPFAVKVATFLPPDLQAP